MDNERNFDCLVIGAGMSGLAAAIRLSMFGKSVALLESHTVPGGLNSYYKRGKREFDVGLHALTNYIEKGTKGRPLSKIIKQLRIPYDQFNLVPQKRSRIAFKEVDLFFNNDLEFFKQDIREKFPNQIDGFNTLCSFLANFNETSLDNEYQSAREKVAEYISDPLLAEMIFCPLLIYGSAWEHDMDLSQFAIMFKSIFVEGFSRPEGGVRTIINLLIEKLQKNGLDISYKHRVEKINHDNGIVTGVTLHTGEVLTAPKVLSSAGLPETLKLTGNEVELPPTGKMTFTESILMLDRRPTEFGIDDTIIFYNDGNQYQYRNPGTLYDPASAVICFPNNFASDEFDEGICRVTMMADFEKWAELERKDYLAHKSKVADVSLKLMNKFASDSETNVVFKDVFTPKTIKRYTDHLGGCVYGSPEKSRTGKTDIEGLFVIGTDQGFLGIVGAMLSGISMANLHVLQGDV
jgi:phytoene dehydrogenase-like protein